MKQRVVKPKTRYIPETVLMRYIPKTGRYWEDKIRELLVKVTLYQLGLYPPDKLEKELNEFFRQAEKPLCEAIRRNGGICFQEWLEEMTPKEAYEEIRSEAENFRMESRTGKMIANLLLLSYDLYRARNLPIKDKILVFDKLVHAVHGAGAFPEEFSYEEASIFNVNIPKVKKEADIILFEILSKLR